MAEFDQATIDRLEKQARDNPGAYKRDLFFLALLGYCYVALVVIGLLVASVLLVVLLVALHAYVLVKFAFLFPGAIAVILKSMWVKYAPPEGFELKRADVPKLFEMIDEVQHKSGGPHIHKVLLDSNFNCAVSQFPRMGIFGIYENYVLLGLPLLDSLPVSKFKAVLAHEMGHLSGQNGKFGSWIYHVKRSWLQTYVNLSVNKLGNSPIKNFANWFVPKFEIHSLALCRQQELAADRIAGEICGNAVAANALITTEIKGGILDKEYWPGLLKEIRTHAEPINGVYYRLRDASHQAIAPNTVLDVLRSKWRQHNPLDSHPSLSERVNALQPKKDWSNLEALANELANEPSEGPNSAEVLLGSHLKHVTDELSSQWKKAVLERWTMEHAKYKESKTAFDAIQKDMGDTTPTDAQAVILIRLAFNTMNSEDLASFILPLYKLYPNNSEIGIHYGIALLKADAAESEKGIAIVEKAIESRPSFGEEGFAAIAHYLYTHGKEKEAESYAERSEEFGERMRKAYQAASSLTLEDKYEEHKESPETVSKICNALYANPHVKDAYLVGKILDDIIGGSRPVLVIKLDIPFLNPNQLEFARKVVRELSLYDAIAGIYIIAWVSVKKNLAQSVQIIEGAHIYERKTFLCDPSSQDYQDAEKIRKQGAANKSGKRTNLILALVILGAIAAMIFTSWNTPHQQANNQSTRRFQQMHYDNNESYMGDLQRAIKQNWHPPRSNQSSRTVVAFRVAPSGDISNIRITESSSEEAMDRAAILAVKRCSPFAKLPPVDPDTVDVQITLDYKVSNSKH